MPTGRTRRVPVSLSHSRGLASAARRLASGAALAAVLGYLSGAARAQDSCPEWTPGLFASQGTDRAVHALLTWDDGTGPAVFAGGAFTAAGGTAANRVAKWTGSEWRSLGAGVNGDVHALAVFDDGSGPALFAGGSFNRAGDAPASNIARWDGAAWSPVGSGTDRPVRAFAVWDDGRGPALYAGGDFTSAGGVAANHVARYDGSAFSPLGSGIATLQGLVVQALAAYDDGSGSALYVGGSFVQAGGAAASRLARWNGTAWSQVGNGLNGEVTTLLVFDDGRGTALFAGGGFSAAISSVAARRVVRWNGSAYSTLGPGLGGRVRSLHAHDDGSGSPFLYAAGDFDRTDDGVPARHVARWSGAAWSALGAGTDQPVSAMASFDDGTGPGLFVGGPFRAAGSVTAESVAKWQRDAWRGLGLGGLGNSVRALAAFDDGSGPALYAGGTFATAGTSDASRIARWSGSGWSPVGTGLAGAVNALAVHDDGSGLALYAAGEFSLAGTTRVNFVARWDGAAWTALASGLPAPVLALTVYDDGRGPSLYAGGGFGSQIGGIRGIARWDGTAWVAVGGGIQGVVRSLSVFDDGSRRVLVAGGVLAMAGGVAVANVASFDGTAWSPLGAGLAGSVLAMTPFDDGSGPALVAGGEFTTTGGLQVSRIALWDGASWRPLLSGANAAVRALTAFDDGSGLALYAGGDFSLIGGVTAFRIARWNGAAFSALDEGVDASVLALAALPDPEGFALFAGGDFLRAGGVSSSRIARYFDPCAACRAGNVDARSGRPSDVLYVNDSAGGRSRSLVLATYEPLTILMSAPPAAVGPAPFALYLWVGAVDPEGRRILPAGLGSTCMPTPLSGGSARLRAVWNNTGKPLLGAATLASTPAPSVVVSRPSGAGRTARFFIQGIIADPGAIGLRPASVTNGLAVEIR